MPFHVKIAWIVVAICATAAAAAILFPTAWLGERADFLLYHRGGFAPGTIFRAVAGIGLAAALYATIYQGTLLRAWRRGREALARKPGVYIASMAAIAGVGFASALTLASGGVCLQPDSESYLTFSPQRTIGYPAFIHLLGGTDGKWGWLIPVQAAVLVAGLTALAHQIGRVCEDRLAAIAVLVLSAGNASLVGYTGLVLAETPFATLLAVHLAAVAALCVRFSWGAALTSGLALGLAILMRPAGYAFLGALPSLVLLIAQRRVVGTLAVAAAVAAPLLAASAVNLAKHGFFATQSIGGYSLLGHTAHLIAPDMPTAFDGLPSRIAERTAPFRDEIGAARFPHGAWRAGMNLYNPQLYGAVIPAIETWLAERPAVDQSTIDDLVVRLAREAIRHDPVGYARQVAAQYYGLWLLSFLPHGPIVARQQACFGEGTKASVSADRLTPIDVFWAIATVGQFPALGVAFVACWLAIPAWLFAMRRNQAWRFAIYVGLGINAYFLGFSSTQVALPRYSTVVEPWLAALLIALACASALADTQNRDQMPADRTR